MKLRSWYEKRGAKFIWQRGLSLLERYSLGPDKAIGRINDCVACLSDMGCAPTFFIPGIIVQRNPAFIRSLQAAGAEIAVHSFQHINLAELTTNEARAQLEKAAQTFDRLGIEMRGFRCPYLGFTEELLNSLPSGLFTYSSNQTIFWNVIDQGDSENNGVFFNTLSKFYRAIDSSQMVCLPRMRANMLEIPVCVPDDLQIRDGLQLDQEGIVQMWKQILQQTYQRGELFSLIFHTEQAAYCDNPLMELIDYARQLNPSVWISRQREISEWWYSKATFKVEIDQTNAGLQITFLCSPHATILGKGIEVNGSGSKWYGNYLLFQARTIEVPSSPRPFLGLAPDIPEKTVSFLREQGYILEIGEHASQCGIYLDASIVVELGSEICLIDYIESKPVPLVRFWRWPDGARSALCLTGDLDALTLWDYISRLLPN